PLADTAKIRLARARQAWQAAAQEANYGIWHSDDLEWTVTLEKELISPEALGYRYLPLIPVGDLADVVERLQPWRHYLQNIGLGCSKEELLPAARILARMGASRICEPGKMGEPSMVWRHDGHMCVANLVRWCDVEGHRYLQPSPSYAAAAERIVEM